MAITTSCCLNLSSPTPSSPSKPTQLLLPCHKNDKWRRKCVVGMACVVIGLQMGSFEEAAIARDMNNNTMPLTIVSKADHQVPRWSDKRMCPPWNLNSLETIVPENLPRPSARRRWESIHYSSKTAPVIIISRSSSSDCFSM
ncbi:hypothetical protein Q3G72_021573 [Acer saccharum]|nr:hypothetical protein Q3G72_016271 [Acer saccharum]KAK1550584.1 hypothetical protein Q3G72_021573 [Acer saccharum]